MIVGGLGGLGGERGGEGLFCFLEGLLVFFSIEGSEVEGLESSEGLLVFGDFILLTRGSSSRS